MYKKNQLKQILFFYVLIPKSTKPPFFRHLYIIWKINFFDLHNWKILWIKYINDITNTNREKDNIIISELKNIPNGGIKGLLYYKVISSINKNITPVLDIDKSCAEYLKKLTVDENKIISKAIGVYIDNAIDATSLTTNKIVSIEIYFINNEINFVISNPFLQNNTNISKISQKGYTTKGKGHGNGIYLIDKIIKKTDWLKSERKIINNYYIQKLTIKKIG